MNIFFLTDFKSYKKVFIIQICLDLSVMCKLKLFFYAYPYLLSNFQVLQVHI